MGDGRRMIVTPRFVFLHLHKSGGTFVNECLLRFVPDARQIGYHLPRSLTPAPYLSLPALGLVRNPWSYYVSWFSFQARRQQPNALFRVLSDGGTLGFRATLHNLLALGTGGERLDRVLTALPSQYTGRGLNLPSFALELIRASNLGFYSYLYRYLYDGPGVLHVGRMETMRQDLTRMLVSVGQGVSTGMRRYIEEEPARNVSEHGAYADYYDDETRELVATLDHSVIAKHGYRFDQR